jgi:hypothetical protein
MAITQRGNAFRVHIWHHQKFVTTRTFQSRRDAELFESAEKAKLLLSERSGEITLEPHPTGAGIALHGVTKPFLIPTTEANAYRLLVGDDALAKRMSAFPTSSSCSSEASSTSAPRSNGRSPTASSNACTARSSTSISASRAGVPASRPSTRCRPCSTSTSSNTIRHHNTHLSMPLM